MDGWRTEPVREHVPQPLIGIEDASATQMGQMRIALADNPLLRSARSHGLSSI